MGLLLRTIALLAGSWLLMASPGWSQSEPGRAGWASVPFGRASAVRAQGLPVSPTVRKVDSLRAITKPGYYAALLVSQLQTAGRSGARVATGCNTYLCTAAVLPVTLRYFDGRNTPAGNLLGWETAREDNNARFNIERSRARNAGPGLSFESIATIPTQAVDGNSETSLTYSYLDADLLPGVSYYRLLQTDRNGSQTRSRIVALSKAGQEPVLYPNPVSAAGEAVVEPAVAYTSYRLSDVLGRVVQQADAPGVLRRVSLSGLPAGVYMLQVEQPDGMVKRFRVVR